MATVTQLKNRIAVRLSRRTTGATILTEIVDALDHAQTEILEQSPTLPHFLKVTETVSAVGAHSELDLTTTTRTFLRLQEDHALSYVDDEITEGDDRVPIERHDNLVQLNQLHPGEAEVPVRFYWNSSSVGVIQLRPYVTASLDYSLLFYGADDATPSDPDGDDMTLWTRFAGDLLMHTAGVEVAEYLRDADALKYFSAKRQEAHNRFLRSQFGLEFAGQELVMGE